MTRVLTVNDVLDVHVTLDIECLERIYLNAYVPILQTSSQVVAFLSGHLGFPFSSPALFRQLGDRFRKAVASFADANHIPWVRFGKDEAKLEVMAPYLARAGRHPLRSHRIGHRPARYRVHLTSMHDQFRRLILLPGDGTPCPGGSKAPGPQPPFHSGPAEKISRTSRTA
jgi:hypothetical protein